MNTSSNMNPSLTILHRVIKFEAKKKIWLVYNLMAKDYPLRQDLLHQTKALKIISRWIVKRTTVKTQVCTSPCAFFRSSIFDVYLLWPFGKELIYIIKTCVNTRDFTVYLFTLSSSLLGSRSLLKNHQSLYVFLYLFHEIK